MEVWKPIEALHSVYEVSDLGNIRFARTQRIKSAVSDGHYMKFGYDYVHNGERYRGWYRVHKAVAEAFLPNPECKPTVNHKDGNRGNNALSNLEWATAKEQSEHSAKILKRNCGESHYLAQFSNNEVREMRRMYEQDGKNIHELATIFHTTPKEARRIVKYERWKYI